MSCSLTHLSLGCNRVVHCADWSPAGLYAFGGGSFVALWRPAAAHPAVHTALPGHTGRVNCVRWVRPHGCELITGGADGRIICWQFEEGGDRPVSHQVHAAHAESVLYVEGQELHGPRTGARTLLVSVAAAPEVKLWLRPAAGAFSVLQSLPFSVKELMHCAALCPLPSESSAATPVLLALGGVDSAVHLYLAAEWDVPAPSFQRMFTLRGHQDWVRCLRFSPAAVASSSSAAGGGVLLASTSQDARIRLWRFERAVPDTLRPEEVAELDASSSSSSVNTLRCGENQWLFSAAGPGGAVWQATLDAVLVGHEDWVMDVQWPPPTIDADGRRRQPLSLLSCSMDRTMVIWAPDPQTSIWNNILSVGEFGGLTGLFSQLGFYGCHWGPDGDAILSHGYVGEFHLWVRRGGGWEAQPVPTGHSAAVVDLAWHASGLCVTVSADQTTRVHVPRVKGEQYFELARAQIHGHDLTSVVLLQPDSSGVTIASGAEEKVVRVFDAPALFFASLQRLTDLNLCPSAARTPLAAACPALGLSNKPIMDAGDLDAAALNSDRVQVGESDMFDQAMPELSALQGLPLEEQLLQSTLWPERLKLYGHPNEIVCVAANARHLASACKAQAAAMADVIVWDIATCRQLFALPGHALTVTQLAYSPAGDRLLSVSRDRHFLLWDATTAPYLLLHCGAAHGRIIWTCAWAPGADHLFATGSRDETWKLWAADSPAEPLHTAALPGPCTALAFAPLTSPHACVAAVGLGSGAIWLYRVAAGGREAVPILQVAEALAHTGFIHRLAFAPVREPTGVLRLASCSDDHSFRILRLEGLEQEAA
eukprot:EG_transcript_2701